MRINEVVFDDARPFDGYGPGFFRVGGTVHQGHLIVWRNGLRSWEGYGDAAALLALSAEIDVVLVGTGEQIAFPPADFRSTLEEAGIGVEMMASPAACRTYNVLLAEGRRVAAAVLTV